MIHRQLVDTINPNIKIFHNPLAEDYEVVHEDPQTGNLNFQYADTIEDAYGIAIGFESEDLIAGDMLEHDLDQCFIEDDDDLFPITIGL